MNGGNDKDKIYWMDMSCKETGSLTDEEAAQYSELPFMLCLAFVMSFVIFAAVVMFT